MKARKLPPLLTIAEACAAVEAEGLTLSPGQLKRILTGAAARKPQLVIFSGRRWLIVASELRDLLGLPDLPGVEPRVFDLEVKVDRLERQGTRRGA